MNTQPPVDPIFGPETAGVSPIVVVTPADEARVASVRALLESAGVDWAVVCAQSGGGGSLPADLGRAGAVLVDGRSTGIRSKGECLAAVKAFAQVPTIWLCDSGLEAMAEELLHQGLHDYLPADRLDGRSLVHAIRYAVERRCVEEALYQERYLLHTLLDSLPDRIYFKDTQSRFTRINAAVAQQFCLRHPREVVGSTDFDFFARDHALAAFEDEARVMRTGEPILGKVEREVLPDGRVTWALTSKLPLRNTQGRVIGNFGISRDITLLKEAQDQLASERNLLLSLIDNLPDPIYVKDSECRFLLDNSAHRRLLGVQSVQDILGRTAAEFHPAEQTRSYTEDDYRVLQTGVPLVDREELIFDRSGIGRWHLTTKVPLRNRAGAIEGLVAMSRDISESKSAEARLQAANQELARSQSNLLHVLTDLQHSHEELKAAHSQLIQAEKLESVGRLAAGVAHEVKNPLAILRMGLDFIRHAAPSTSDTDQVLRDMQDAIDRADSIILGLLDFSVPRNLDLRPEDLNTVVDNSLSLVRHELASAGIEVRRETAADLPRVQLDRDKIKQVLINLLTNAVHAMPEGGTLTLRTSCRPLGVGELVRDEGSRMADRFRVGEPIALLEVLDTGLGIPPEKLARICDPFFTTKPAGKGTGLGLSVTRRIVELHAGVLEISNRKEGGVCVKVWLKV